jgi:hypothetical protein
MRLFGIDCAQATLLTGRVRGRNQQANLQGCDYREQQTVTTDDQFGSDPHFVLLNKHQEFPNEPMAIRVRQIRAVVLGSVWSLRP